MPTRQRALPWGGVCVQGLLLCECSPWVGPGAEGLSLSWLLPPCEMLPLLPSPICEMGLSPPIGRAFSR